DFLVLEENFAHAALVTTGGQNVAPPRGGSRPDLRLFSASDNNTNPIATAQDDRKTILARLHRLIAAPQSTHQNTTLMDYCKNRQPSRWGNVNRRKSFVPFRLGSLISCF